MSVKHSVEYDHCIVIGAYIMQCLIEQSHDGKGATTMMGEYTKLGARALGYEVTQLAIEIAECHKRLYRMGKGTEINAR